MSRLPLALFLLLPFAVAAKPPPEPAPWAAAVDVARETDRTNTLTFPDASLPRRQGYDVYYTAAEPAPGQNGGRIGSGASSPFNDIDGAGRCDGSNYWVYAYSNGRKAYAGPIRGHGDLCGTDPREPDGPTDPEDPSGPDGPLAAIPVERVENPVGATCGVSSPTRLRRDGDSGLPLRSDGTRYRLEIEDEFTGELDPSLWHTKQGWSTSTIVNEEDQMYIDVLGEDADVPFSPFVPGLNGEGVRDYLVIRPARSADTLVSASVSEGQPYLSGLIRSRRAFTEGYFEVSAKLAPGTGLWSAFWLYTAEYRHDPEYDIEYIGQERSLDVADPQRNLGYDTYQTLYNASHRRAVAGGALSSELEWNNADANHTPEFCGVTHDFSKEFHTYGIQVSAEAVRFYVDDVLTYTTDDPAMLPQGEALYLIFNVALGGGWPKDVTPQTDSAIGAGKVFAAIDRIRIYQ